MDFAQDLLLQSIKEKMDDTSKKTAQEEVDVKLDLLRYLRATIDTVTSKNDLKSSVVALLQTRLAEDADEMSTGTLIRLFEVLSKVETDMSGHILGILKQQITIQQNNINSNNTLSLNKNETKAVESHESKQISKEEYNKFKNVYEFLEKAKQIESSENIAEGVLVEEKEIK